MTLDEAFREVQKLSSKFGYEYVIYKTKENYSVVRSIIFWRHIKPREGVEVIAVISGERC